MNSEQISINTRQELPGRKSQKPVKRVLFVCYGNICRSPSAQGIFSCLANRTTNSFEYVVDSAGTHDFHIGKEPDSRAIAAAWVAGVDISEQRARQFTPDDFERFDHIFVMDERNQKFLEAICPPQHANKVKPLINCFPESGLKAVPDPFHGNDKDFQEMIELLFDTCAGAINMLDRVAA